MMPPDVEPMVGDAGEMNGDAEPCGIAVNRCGGALLGNTTEYNGNLKLLENDSFGEPQPIYNSVGAERR